MDILVTIESPNTTGQFGCIDSLDILITSTDFNPATLEDIDICYDTLVCLNPNFNPDYDYTWTMNGEFLSNEPNPCVALTESASFAVTITDSMSNALGCTATDSMEVLYVTILIKLICF